MLNPTKAPKSIRCFYLKPHSQKTNLKSAFRAKLSCLCTVL